MSAMERVGGIRPDKELEFVPMPVIDFQQLHSRTRTTVIKDIGRACQKLGCFQVVNHGISRSVIKDALEAASGFFELPVEKKMQFSSEDIRKPVRYDAAPMLSEGKSRTLLKHYAHPLKNWVHLWPQNPPQYRKQMGKYAVDVRRVAQQLLHAIFESLGLGQTHLRGKLDEGLQLIAVNCYPKNSQSDVMVGLAPHSDYGLITILLQSCDGLQIMDSDGKSWRRVMASYDTLHVHVGDHLEVLSNGRYKSLVHRAVLNSHARISVASIHGFPIDEKVSIPQELVDEQHPRRYRESSFKDFLDYVSTTNMAGGTSFINSLKIFEA
ncbi:flavanone 3-dioxygenase 3 [Typha angustifolia]|uniref:flavanone 3-dioxygenase 3 n=1 Tax=Typha angustifolia TaxID=59011 RepID=UPI003C2EA926